MIMESNNQVDDWIWNQMNGMEMELNGMEWNQESNAM